MCSGKSFFLRELENNYNRQKVCLITHKELKWCQHSRPILKKVPNKQKAKNVSNKKPDKFGEAANPTNFTSQAQATNIQPTTLSLIFSIALYVSSSTARCGNDPVDQTVIPENSWKKDKQKVHVTDDKQVKNHKNQSTTAKPGAKTLDKNPKKDKKSSIPEATQILTGYKAVGDEQEQI
ncbi:hypothetical protein RhiirA4_481631 [Rhizophagus irregularis]|uniref:Uncharacterized protein n=1 Tax=Rhizophagus irregularis TaxID=588596 RepID=A0A2I1HJR8_9GLOM|nr:hypothetical protein RhiirA4_481631 [Rhizophagus irregularis]